MTDFLLETKAIRGEEEAILRVIELNKTKLYRIAYRYLYNKHDVIEAVQECIYRFLVKAHTIKEPQYLVTWLVSILINICKDIKRIQARMELSDSIEKIEYNEISSIDLTEAIKNLTEDQQQLINYKYYKDLKYLEIAKIMNTPVSTVKSRVQVALRELRFFLQEA